ncbi:histone-lysine N-methyltransferase SETMAR, partial [Trichonephila clavipes]
GKLDAVDLLLDPPHSPYFKRLDFFFWGPLKSLVYEMPVGLFSCELQGVKNRSKQIANSVIFTVLLTASQGPEIANGVYGADTVTANSVQFWFHRFRSGIFDFKDAPRTGKPIIENVDKITEIIKVERHARVVASPRSERSTIKQF